MVYSVVIVIIMLLSFFKDRLSRRQREPFFLISCFFLLGLLAGFRYEDSYSDFQVNYRRMLQVYSMDWNNVFHYSSEFLHQIYRKIISVIFKDPQWYFIISSLLIVGIYMKVAERFAEDDFLFVLLYYAVFSYFPANNITRQCIAVALTMLSWEYLLNKNIVKFILIILAAFWVHNTALIFAPLYLISYKKLNKNTLLGYFIIGTVVVIFNRPIILFIQRFAYSEYVEGSYGTTASNPLRIVLAILSLAAMFVYISKSDNSSNIFDDTERVKKNRYNNFILHGTFMFVMCYVFSTIRMLLFARIALYFAPCSILCIIHAIESHKGTKNYIIYKWLVILFALLWFGMMNYAGKLIPTPYIPFWEFPSRMRFR